MTAPYGWRHRLIAWWHGPDHAHLRAAQERRRRLARVTTP